MEWETLGHVQAAEQGWRRLRWAAGLIAALWVILAAPEMPPALTLSSRWLAPAILVAIAAIDRVARGIGTLRSVEAVRRAARLVVTGDALLCVVMLAVFTDAPDSAGWALLAVPVLEGALLWGVRGAVWTWAATAVAYLALALLPALGPGGLVPGRALARLAVTLLIGLIGGAMGDSLRTQRDALVRAREEWAHRATHDPLTGTPNRALFGDRLRQALARSARDGAAAVLFVDCNNFKEVNDRYGHTVGDRVLVQLAARMTEAVRPGDTVARIGGDEFVVLLEGLESPEEAIRVAERLVERVAATPLPVGDAAVQVTVTVGIAVAPAPTVNGEDLVTAADRAMYRAKQGGRKWATADDL